MTTVAMQQKSYPITIKSTGTPRQYRFIISTGSPDREHDVIDPNGWQLDEYRKNPVVLWQHSYSTPPIAKTVDIRVAGTALHATCEFPPEGVFPLADQIRGLIDAGVLRSASVGFRPERKMFVAERNGFDILEATLLEWSIVNVPANSEATIQRCIGLGCADQTTMTKWLKGSSCGCASNEDISLQDIPYVERDADSFALTLDDEDVLVIDDEDQLIDLPDRLVRNAVGAAMVAGFRDLVSHAVARSINRARGRVDFLD